MSKKIVKKPELKVKKAQRSASKVQKKSIDKKKYKGKGQKSADAPPEADPKSMLQRIKTACEKAVDKLACMAVNATK